MNKLNPHSRTAWLQSALSRPSPWATMIVTLAVCGIATLLGYIPVSGFLVLLGFMAALAVLAGAWVFYWLWPPRPAPVVEGTRLVQRRQPNWVLAAIDLSRPFRAECAYHSDERAYIRVRQDRTTLRFAVRLGNDAGCGHLMRDILKLQWPPQARIAFWP
jgi:hypothetical protein